MIKNVNGIIYITLTILGLIILINNKTSKISIDEKLLFIALSTLFITSQLTTFLTDTEYKYIWVFVYLPLTIPIYIYIKNTPIKPFYFWYGLVLGALISSNIAIYEIWKNLPRAQSITHPIIFGNLSLCMGFLSISGIGWFKKQHKYLIFLPILAAISGLISSALSGTRGGWVSIPFILLTYVWYSKKNLSVKSTTIAIISTTVLFSALYIIPQTTIKSNINRTLTSIEDYNNGDIESHYYATSIGARFEMWKAAWKIFTENPGTGVGWHNFKKHAQKQVDDGLRNRTVGLHTNAHSLYLSILATGGTLNFISLIVLFSILIYLFVKKIDNSKTPEARQFALAGLILIVIFMITGISSSPLERARPSNFFSFYLAFIMAFIYRFEKGLEESYGREEKEL
ncbi:MAG: O-antigen ligase [Pseudomonadota bacterium]